MANIRKEQELEGRVGLLGFFLITTLIISVRLLNSIDDVIYIDSEQIDALNNECTANEGYTHLTIDLNVRDNYPETIAVTCKNGAVFSARYKRTLRNQMSRFELNNLENENE